jgi:3-deoxy-7-phosphoheptulonate synthase
MIITLRSNVTPAEVATIEQFVTSLGWKVTRVNTQTSQYLVGIGSREFDIRRVGQLAGVGDVHRVSDPYKLVSSTWRVHPTVINLGDSVRIGGGGHTIMAGPCSIESPEQVALTVDFLKQHGVGVMRGGVFKPRSSPYTFRGLGMDGLRSFAEIAHARGVKIITEVLDAAQIEAMYDYVDIYQVGARNSQNFTLLDELGRVDKPVLIKRGMSGTLEELLQSAEYVFARGNERIMLCERGIRTFEKAYRNTLDLNAVPFLKERSHLPVIVDPSHGIGVRRWVPAVALAGVVAGADGTLLEIHEQPEEAVSDGAQSLQFREAAALFEKLSRLQQLRSEGAV